MPMRTLKVCLGDDIVRLNVELEAGSASQTTVEHIHAAVVRALGLPQDAKLVLKYADDEGDLCTLTLHTLEDLLTLVPSGPIRIQASVEAAEKEVPTAVTEASSTNCSASEKRDDSEDKQHGSAGEQQQDTSSTASAAGDSQPVPNPMAALIAGMAAQHVPMWLPPLARELQRAEKQAEFNQLGIREREKILSHCECLAHKLAALPETEILKPALEAYVSGSDADNFGVFLANLLQAYAAAVADGRLPLVQSIVRDVATSVASLGGSRGAPPGFPDLGALMGTLFAGKGNGKGQGADCASQPSAPVPDVGALLGGLFAGKGLGKGAGAGTQSPPASAQQSSPPPDLGALLGGLVGAAKGLGKGLGASQPTSGTPDLGGLLGNLLAAKGLGKGRSSSTYSSEPVPPAQDQSQGEGAPPAAPAQAQSNYEEEVADLMDMGLVTDAEVARDLLRNHGGDLSLVVAMLTAE